jgi:hypothetical protein
MKIVDESHLDHSLSEAQKAYLSEKFADRDEFFIETFELPEELGTVPCGLHGPTMGDEAITESEVTYAKRGDRDGSSRMVSLPTRETRMVSVIAGPHGEETCILYTAFGGPVAPKEPFDPSLKDDATALSESEDFWATHALSVIEA